MDHAPCAPRGGAARDAGNGRRRRRARRDRIHRRVRGPPDQGRGVEAARVPRRFGGRAVHAQPRGARAGAAQDPHATECAHRGLVLGGLVAHVLRRRRRVARRGLAGDASADAGAHAARHAQLQRPGHGFDDHAHAARVDRALPHAGMAGDCGQGDGGRRRVTATRWHARAHVRDRTGAAPAAE